MTGNSASRAEMHGLAEWLSTAAGTWERSSLPKRVLLTVAAMLMVAASVASTILALRQDDEVLRTVVVLLTGSGAVAVIVVKLIGARAPARVLDPLAGPLLYLGYCLLVPLGYMTVTGSGIQTMPSSMLNGATVAVLCLSICGFVVGAAIFQLFTNPSTVDGERSADSDRRGPITRDIGRLILLVALAAKLYQLIVEGPVFLRIYGEGQLDYDLNAFVGVLGGSLVPVGSLLIMHGNMKIRDRPLARPDWIILGSIAVLSLVFLGNRSELIAPVVLFLWFQLRSAKKFPLAAVVGVVAVVGALFAIVAQVRVRNSGADGYPLIENVLVDTSSPILLTSDVTRLVPSEFGFYWGSTYIEALKFSLPGPLSRLLFGDPTGTGAFVYRDLIDFRETGQGYGFAMPTEAYLNFGFAGVAIIAVAVGVLFAWAYWSAQRTSYGMRALVYPLLVSYLAFGVRSDALGQFKSVVYPLVIMALALAIERVLLRRTGGPSGSHEWRWSSLAPGRHGPA
ncbi:MAG: O-antigen polymerase [Pseudolysinimonas sp.]